VVTEWPTPIDMKQLQQYLEFANYYRRFICGFAHVAVPLHKVTGNTEWRWDSEEQLAFTDLKAAITSAPVLSLPKNDNPYAVEPDSSGYATGATLSQKQDGVWKAVAFGSKSLNDVERNYEIPYGESARHLVIVPGAYASDGLRINIFLFRLYFYIYTCRLLDCV
jgi:hypothetical protein